MLLDACSRDTALHVEYCAPVQIHSQRLEFASRQCCETNQDSCVISKSKAKEAFLLGKQDLKNLVSISHQVPLVIQ
jgi:hypothetical protein